MGLVTEFDVDTKRYHIKVSTDNWLAAVILSNGVYSKPILYEKIEDLSVGSLYKRSSFLPEMVEKRCFFRLFKPIFLIYRINKFLIYVYS